MSKMKLACMALVNQPKLSTQKLMVKLEGKKHKRMIVIHAILLAILSIVLMGFYFDRLLSAIIW